MFIVVLGITTSVYSNKVLAQTVLGARALGMGEAQVALPHNDWSVFGNPAMISSDQKSGSFYGIRNFGFSELKDIAAVAVIPNKFGTAGVGVHRFGDDLFSETRARVAYKNKFNGFHYGGVINYTINSIEGYGSDGAFGVDVGIAAEPIEGLWVGGMATNVNQPEIGDEEEELIQILGFGFTYAIFDRALFISDIIKDLEFSASYRGGLEIYIIEGLTGRVGVTTKPVAFTFGMGYKADRWGLNIGVRRHQVLDLSPGIDLKIAW